MTGSRRAKLVSGAAWLRLLWRRLVESRFVRNVLIVAGGTAAAQAIGVGFSPIVTRLYGPEVFGVVGIFMASVSAIGPLATLSYGMAVVLPPTDGEARALMRLSIYIGITVAALTLLIALFCHQAIAEVIGFTAPSALLLLAPAMILVSAVDQPLSQWLVRKKAFKPLSRIGVFDASAMGISKSVIGLAVATAPVLLLLNVIGRALHTLLLWCAARKTLAAHDVGEHGPMLKAVAVRYRDFPLFRAPQDWLTSVSLAMPPLLLAAFFGPATAGFFAIARTVLALPSSLISSAVGTVFLPRIVDAARCGDSLRPLVIKATTGLAIAGFIPFAVVISFGPSLFALAFGPDWMPAGEYARWLSVWLYFSFLNPPSCQVLVVSGLQGPFLIFQTVTETLRFGALAAGAYLIGSALAALALFSLVGCVANLWLIVWAITSCHTQTRNNMRPVASPV